MARVWVLYASNEQRREVDRLLAALFLRASWKPQPFQPSGSQSFFEVSLEASEIAAGLARTGVVFEVEAEDERFLHHPGLGLKRQQLDAAGEVVVRFGQLRRELAESAGNHQEFQRRLRLLEGQPWLDLMEPYRLSLLRSDQMPKAV
jgi:hypothetical protein